jgi:hypothetical protein
MKSLITKKTKETTSTALCCAKTTQLAPGCHN